jgi:hypothetical protein
MCFEIDLNAFNNKENFLKIVEEIAKNFVTVNTVSSDELKSLERF